MREGSCAAENLKLGGVAWSMRACVRAPDDGRGKERLRKAKGRVEAEREQRKEGQLLMPWYIKQNWIEKTYFFSNRSVGFYLILPNQFLL